MSYQIQDYGWETSDTDVEQALTNLNLPNGENDVAEVLEWLDTDAVENAALYGVGMFEQTEFAIQNIEEQVSQRC